MLSKQANNKLIIAAAGSGKTTFLVEEALKQIDVIGNQQCTVFGK
ncbi:UvrD/REP helicase N-terminal domain-containing protein [Arachidicoccus rhizosphaerae]|uniref:UvrD/REP helicase N-terminal domain-containing protein n=1 Tax=Arachidicoccus rhizosphaerae TaxID=551991 RepID=A0A1H3YUG5_9BACT|nr:UvrD/REP helicase N-terminal domain-containing protein [Arachidicoccus rhizosphaerae]